jgi:hypothetical protein
MLDRFSCIATHGQKKNEIKVLIILFVTIIINYLYLEITEHRAIFQRELIVEISNSSVNGCFRVETTEVRRVHVHSSLLVVTSNQNASNKKKIA